MPWGVVSAIRQGIKEGKSPLFHLKNLPCSSLPSPEPLSGSGNNQINWMCASRSTILRRDEQCSRSNDSHYR